MQINSEKFIEPKLGVDLNPDQRFGGVIDRERVNLGYLKKDRMSFDDHTLLRRERKGVVK